MHIKTNMSQRCINLRRKDEENFIYIMFQFDLKVFYLMVNLLIIQNF